METSPENQSRLTKRAVERLAQLNRELFGEEVVIIDATGYVPHKLEQPEKPAA